jgi:hypothetical protein
MVKILVPPSISGIQRSPFAINITQILPQDEALPIRRQPHQRGRQTDPSSEMGDAISLSSVREDIEIGVTIGFNGKSYL